MKIEVDGMEKAQAFWSVARGGKLDIVFGSPVIFTSEEAAKSWCASDERPVRVYLIVEDD